MIWMITKILQNKFDMVIVIDGNTGIGKSTLAIHLGRGVAKEFKKQGSEDYKFHWGKSLIYSRKQNKNFLHKWRSIGIIDEAVMTIFNRDFYSEEQKDIVKMINTNRDHTNLIIFCVPRFQVIDNQMKNLCKLRITVVRRGLCIIQTPQKSIYLKDKWDTSTNEKIERQWMMKGITKPKYTRLTTFRGMLKFRKLHPTIEARYIKIKDKMRNIIAKEEMGIDDEEKKKIDPIAETIEKLKAGKIRNNVFLDGLAVGYGLDQTSFKEKISRELKKIGDDHHLANYYWEKQKKSSNERRSALQI